MSSQQQSNQSETTTTNQTSTSNQTNNHQFAYQNKDLESFIESSYLTIKDGETKVLEFVPNLTRIIEKPDFNGKMAKRAQFTVIEVNDANRKQKIFELSRLHIQKIYDELKKGRTILEISRSGSAKDTRYFIKVVR
jgi:hypothetical protein